MPCNGIAHLVSQSLDHDLTRTERVAIRLHELYCTACRRYRNHIQNLRRFINDAAGDSAPQTRLSPEAKRRIIQLLKPGS